jgi:hypothetical protein
MLKVFIFMCVFHSMSALNCMSFFGMIAVFILLIFVGVMRIFNAFYGTKMMLNPNIPEVSQYRYDVAILLAVIIHTFWFVW